MTATLPILDALLQEFPGIAYRCLNDDSWTMEYISAGVEALAGYAPVDFFGPDRRKYDEIIHADDRDRVRQEIHQALAANTGFVLAYRIVATDGAIRFVNEYGHAIRNGDGDVVALQGFVTDVSANEEMRQALDQATERFRWIAQATNDNIWEWDLETDRLWNGTNVHGTFALPSDATTPGVECWTNLVHPDDLPWVRSSITTALAGTEDEWSAEYRLQRKDGSYADVLSRAFILRDAEDTPVRMVGGLSDLTERKQSKLHLERLYRAMRIMKTCNERLVRAADERGFLSQLCQAMVDTAGYAAASIDVMAPAAPEAVQYDACSLHHAAPASIYTNISWSTDFGQAGRPASLAMQSGKRIICADIANEPLLEGVRAELLGRGYRSAIWLPLQLGPQCLGVLSIYAGAAAAFDSEEAQLLQTLADSLAFGIDAIRSNEKRKRIELAAVKIAAGVSANTGEDFFSHFASNMALAVDADGAFVARFKDDAMQVVETVVAVVNNAVVPNFDYDIAGSPCERLITAPDCVVLNDVAACFPTSAAAQMGMRGYAGCRLDSVGGRPLGLLFVLFRGPVTQPELVTQTIQIFASRAGAELERQRSHARIVEQASLLDKAKDAILMHDAENRITFWNKGAERLYGLTAQAVLGRRVDELVYEDAEGYRSICKSLAQRNEWQGEMVLRRADGRELTLEINSTLVRDAYGLPGSVLSIVTDISRRKAAEREVAKLAFSDRLTGLPNRPMLEKKLQAFLDCGSRGEVDGALLWIDLDHLKSLNDTRGHDMGDRLLRQSGERIASALGTGDIAARFGGDEFVVLMTALGGDPEAAIGTARRLLHSLARPYDLDGYMHSGSASIGLAYFRSGCDAAAEILKHADIAMYEAKAAGRNTLRVFDRQMQDSVNLRVALQNDLRSALQQGNGLYLAYQPQIADTGRVTGVEALLRWDHPTRGPVSPAEFIPVAENSGLIIRCGEWVLEQACTQLRHWKHNPLANTLSIAVNVSAHQVRHPGFVDQVKDVLQRTGADAGKLKLELTESSLVADTEATVEKMKALKAIGISFALDDFGTGFSSLSYLRRLPLDQLKIDRSFVCDVVSDTNAAVITRSIIALAKSLALDVIAEGVETQDQHRFLAMHGCTVYQGYLFSRPVGIEALERYLRLIPLQRSGT